MTEANGAAAVAQLEVLPTVLHTTLAEMQSIGLRVPSEEMYDLLERVGAPPLNELMAADRTKARYMAFRILVRNYPLRDPTSLWMHAHFCELEIAPPDPTEMASMTASPPSANISAAVPATSTS
jgi:hypothetical protein